MKRCAVLVALVGVLILVVVSVVAAQSTPQPVVRLGHWLEVGNEVFMHILGAADVRYRTVHNNDFAGKVRDRTSARDPGSTATHEGDFDGSYAELRFGAEFRYQKNLSMHLLFEHQAVFDGSLIDDRANTSNPGGTDVFGRAAATENPAFHIERYWIDYQFAGTPLRLRVGADLWIQDQAGLVGDDDPRLALFVEQGPFGAMAAAVLQNESQRLGLVNDNDFIYYTFSGWYDFKPHKVQLDVTYFRDRFSGADTQTVGLRSGLGFTGQKNDSVLIMASWSGTLGPVRALLQGNLVTGTSRGGTTGRPLGVAAARQYDIFAGGVVAYAEADFGLVRPFVGVVYGSGDGDPTDNQLHGFATLPQREIALITGTPLFAHLETSNAFATRDYACPARLQGMTGNSTIAHQGAAVLGSGGGIAGTECAHSTGNPLNDRIGNTSHLGLATTYSNPGTILIPVGLRVLPAKGHELAGWFVYRGLAKTDLLNSAFAPQLLAQGRRSIHRSQYYEVGGLYQWTLNPHFDIRISGNIAIPGEGYKDIGRLATCGSTSCSGGDLALVGEARFRARF